MQAERQMGRIHPEAGQRVIGDLRATWLMVGVLDLSPERKG